MNSSAKRLARPVFITRAAPRFLAAILWLSLFRLRFTGLRPSWFRKSIINKSASCAQSFMCAIRCQHLCHIRFISSNTTLVVVARPIPVTAITGQVVAAAGSSEQNLRKPLSIWQGFLFGYSLALSRNTRSLPRDFVSASISAAPNCSLNPMKFGAMAMTALPMISCPALVI